MDILTGVVPASDTRTPGCKPGVPVKSHVHQVFADLR